MTYTEEKNKDCSLEHITITYCDRLVQITCDDALKNYLEAPGKRRSAAQCTHIGGI